MDTARPSATPATGERAIVIGGSIAGLLAARVLADHYAEIVVLERDELPERATPRKGTPHAPHPHGLLARGLQILEQLFPGFSEALAAQGAKPGDIGLEVAVEANGRRFARAALGVSGVGASRLLLESELRRRVRAWPGVRIEPGISVLAPTHEAGRVTGVRAQRTDGTATDQTWPAALVVDCTGRGSRSPAWLRDWGYEPPAEERVTIGLAYTSAYFRREPEAEYEVNAVIGAATPALPRPYILIAQEPDEQGRPRWVAGLGGYAGDHVETTLEAMRRRAEDLGSPEIAAVTKNAELIGPVITYNFPHSQRRYYERMRKLPTGFLVMGDALASFNPIYGQGMTVAACEASALRDTLAGPRDRMAARFFAAAGKIIDVPWQIAVGGDLALPQVPGPRPLPVRLINAYIGRVQQAAVDDPMVAAAFVKVMHLLAPPPSLMTPSLMWRVLRPRRRSVALGTPAVSAVPDLNAIS
jgi:2-polyprenyl-6-methoxyphenol hydroxylase-like FAD-dependent oxidoreductase